MVVKEVEFVGGAVGIVDVATGEVMAESAPTPEVTKEDAKATATLKEGLRRMGAAMAPGVKCPECGADVALVPREGKLYHVCTKQFQEEPSCYWSEEQVKVKKTEESDEGEVAG